MTTTIFIGLGSNIDAEKHLKEAAAMLKKGWPEIRFSHVYKTAAQEHADQADFLNAVAMIETENEPEEILRVLHAIEKRLGKSPPFRFGPRTIDLDLLLYGGQTINLPQLQVPHPEIANRSFVKSGLLECGAPL